MKPNPRVILYGTGRYFINCIEIARRCFEIVAVAESSPKKSIFNNYRLLSPELIHKEDYDYIVIMSGFVDEISETLIENGVAKDRIKTVQYFKPFIELTKEMVFARSVRAIAKAKGEVDGDGLRIRFVINSLGGGGAEKALINLLEQLDRDKWKIHLLVLFDGDTYREKVPQGVDTIYINDEVKNTTCLNIALKFASDAELARVFGYSAPDVDIAFLEGWSTRIVASCHRPYKLAWCHTNLSTNHWTHPYWFKSYEAEELCYSQFSQIVFVSNDSKDGFQKTFPSYPAGRLTVIPNLISSSSRKYLCSNNKQTDTFTFISIGRLVPVKGFKRLISAFRSVVRERVRLIIIGEGAERSILEEHISDLGLDGRVFLPGFIAEPFSSVEADCFISSSFTEGHPLAVAEALLNGLPVIATACGGCTEMLEHGSAGLLVENSEAGLVSGMQRVIKSRSLYSDLVQATKNASVQYTNAQALSDIESLIGAEVAYV